MALNSVTNYSEWRVRLFYMSFLPQAIRIARLRGEGPSAPGRTLLGSGEEAVRLRGENVLVKSLIINLL
ncbi:MULTISPECIES: hypothetical protein [Bacteroides]|uniref:hypothetical protein n=1 Tax=Bacteroides TaxID=816 RepID=UPI00259CA82A|nr:MULTISPECIES: hypothetical protein [Bacteroides]